MEERGHVLVIGAGVIGLTTTWVLLDHGFQVTILSKDFASPSNPTKITSQAAGALWEWPPSVCGRHKNEVSLANAKRWCMASYARFKEMATDTSFEMFGVKLRMSNFFFKHKVEESPAQLAKMLEIKALLSGFRHDSRIIQELGVNPNYGVVDAYQHQAPVIDTDEFMFHVTSLLSNHPRCNLLKGAIMDDLLDIEGILQEQFNVDLIVNCGGLASRELANDESVYPLRGALVRVVNDGKRFPIVNECMCVSLDGRGDAEDMVFIVPRNETTLLIGGIVEAHEWDLSIDKDYPPIRQMVNRSLEFYPPLETAEIDSSYPFVVGLRPSRVANVRVEREARARTKDKKRSVVIHNYGHGGAGFSLSFGCAEDVAGIARSILDEREQSKKAALI